MCTDCCSRWMTVVTWVCLLGDRLTLLDGHVDGTQSVSDGSVTPQLHSAFIQTSHVSVLLPWVYTRPSALYTLCRECASPVSLHFASYILCHECASPVIVHSAFVHTFAVMCFSSDCTLGLRTYFAMSVLLQWVYTRPSYILLPWCASPVIVHSAFVHTLPWCASPVSVHSAFVHTLPWCASPVSVHSAFVCEWEVKQCDSLTVKLKPFQLHVTAVDTLRFELTNNRWVGRLTVNCWHCLVIGRGTVTVR